MGARHTAPAFWIEPDSPISGENRSPQMVEAAREVWPIAVRLCSALLKDSTMAGDLLERAVQHVENRRATKPIQNLAAFLTRVVVRDVRKEHKRQLRTVPFSAANYSAAVNSDLDQRLYLDEVLALMKDDMLDLVLRRAAGLSWAEIGAIFHTDPHRLESRLGYEFRRVRGLLKTTSTAECPKHRSST